MMVWVRLEDGIDEHPKIAALDDHAFAVFVCGLAYCNRNLTDGFIPKEVGMTLRYCNGRVKQAIRTLVESRLWQPADGGWRVHDFLDYQPSREKVESDKAAKQAAGQAGGQASARARGQANTKQNPTPYPVPGPGVNSSLASLDRPGGVGG